MNSRLGWKVFLALLATAGLGAAAAVLARGPAGWAFGFVLALSLAGAFAWLFKRALSDPLREMARAAERIAQGQTTERLPVPSRDEIGALAESINRMTDELARRIDELKRLEQVRVDLVANASHELRTPLTSIKGFVETLEQGALDDPEHARRFLGIIHRHTDRMIVLLDDLLTLSQLDSGDIRLRPEAFDLGDLLKEETAAFQERAERKRLVLRIAAGPSPAPIRADRERVAQVVANLIDNALKYTPPGGRVDVSWERAGDGWAFAVSDSGVGIPEEEQGRVFERFYRADKARSREEGGTGLGLSIVKHLVQAHGGRVELSSEPGRGSTFRVALPDR